VVNDVVSSDSKSEVEILTDVGDSCEAYSKTCKLTIVIKYFAIEQNRLDIPVLAVLPGQRRYVLRAAYPRPALHLRRGSSFPALWGPYYQNMGLRLSHEKARKSSPTHRFAYSL
jgi:hypothetical protein